MNKIKLFGGGGGGGGGAGAGAGAREEERWRVVSNIINKG